MMPTRAITRIYAMARPRRPVAEGAAVRRAASQSGSVPDRARHLARTVAAMAMADIDSDPADRLARLLAGPTGNDIESLATDPTIATAAMIVHERCRRLEARGGRRLHEWEWRREDREVLDAVSGVLALRYAKFLRCK